MAISPSQNTLRDKLAYLVFRQSDIERVVADLGLDPSQIEWDAKPVNTWNSVLAETRRAKMHHALAAWVKWRFPIDFALWQAVDAFPADDAQWGMSSSDGSPVFYVPRTLPPHYIPRHETIVEIRNAILTNMGASGSSPVVKMHALHGMGGLGKSVIARSLCDDPEVRAAFSNGILWTEIGPDTTDAVLRMKMREWIEELGGRIGERVPTKDQLRATLNILLNERACLLVVDNVWKKSHLEHFRVGGPHTCLLFTTRDAAIAEEFGARIHHVPFMETKQAVELLEKWSAESLMATDGKQKEWIVGKLGRLPLAIQLAGPQFARSDPISWLEGFDARLLKTRRVEGIHDSLAATFAVSLDDLDEAARKLYVVLSVFRENEPTPSEVIVRLWSMLAGYSREQSLALLDDLGARALVEISLNPGQQELQGRIVIHNLLREFMAYELGKAERVCAHKALLDSYRQSAKDGAWYSIVDDGYLHDHLAFHLNELADRDAAAERELHELVANRSWFRKRISLSGDLYDRYLGDLEIAQRRALVTGKKREKDNSAAHSLARLVSYALVRASIISLANKLTPALVAQAVEAGLWEPGKAFSLAQRMSDPERRLAMWIALVRLPTLCPDDHFRAQEEALTTAMATEGNEVRAAALASIVALLDEGNRNRAMEQGLAEALLVDDQARSVDLTVAFVPYLSLEKREQVVQQIRSSALRIEDHGGFAAILSSVAPLLVKDEFTGLLKQALDRAFQITERGARLSAIAALAPHLVADQLNRALEQVIKDALAINDEPDEVYAAAPLFMRLSGDDQTRVIDHCLEFALGLEDEWSKVYALVPLAGYLSEVQTCRVLTEVLAITTQWSRAYGLAAIAPNLSEDLLDQSVAAALNITDGESRIHALTALAPRLAGEDRMKVITSALATALHINDDWLQLRALANLVSHLSDTERHRIAELGLAMAETAIDEAEQSETLRSFAPFLDGQLIERAFAVGLAIGDEWLRAVCLAAFAPYLPENLLVKAVTAVEAIADHRSRAYALAALAAHVQADKRDSIAQQSLQVALAVESQRSQASVLTALIPLLPEASRVLAIERVLAALKILGDEKAVLGVLTSLAPHLATTHMEQGLAIARSMGDPGNRANALAAVAPHVPAYELQKVCSEGLLFTLAIEAERPRAAALINWAQHLTGALFEKGVEAAHKLEIEEYRSNALAAFASGLTGDTGKESIVIRGIEAALAIRDHGVSASALARFVPVVEDPVTVIKYIHEAMIEYVRSDLSREPREFVLRFCSEPNLFTPPILDPETLNTIAHYIIEICQEWDWL